MAQPTLHVVPGEPNDMTTRRGVRKVDWAMGISSGNTRRKRRARLP